MADGERAARGHHQAGGGEMVGRDPGPAEIGANRLQSPLDVAAPASVEHDATVPARARDPVPTPYRSPVPRTRLIAAFTTFALLGAAVTFVAPISAGAVGNPPYSSPVNIPADDFPDPFVLRVGTDNWYAYGTDGDLGNVQVMSSPDLVTWTNAAPGGSVNGGALTTAGTWAQNDDVWAPSVLDTGSGYVLYATFVAKATGKRCVGAATSTKPQGPFTAQASPLVCNDAEGGVIDPDVFVTAGGAYLLWKTEGVPGSAAPALFSQPLTASGTGLSGSPARLLVSRFPWEGTLIENPTMVADNGRYYLFYSGNEWESGSYGVGWGVCAGPQGPCVNPPDKPLLISESATLQGPGGGTVFQDENGNWWIGFAAWINNKTTEATGSRKLFFRRLQFQSGRPVIQAPDGSFPAQPFAQRVAGADRYDTAARFSAKTVQASRPITYVATGSAFPDALSSGPASGLEGSPVILVQRDGVPAPARAELARVHPGHIVIMGGTGAISDAVLNDVKQYSVGGNSIHREAGVNRYHTASLVSRNTYKNGAPVAYIATGENFADALAGGAAGARNGGPLLLVERDGIPPDTATELGRLKPGRIVVLGGQGAVSSGVETQLRQYGPVTRIAGTNRYDTAAKVARSEFGTLIGGVVVATGEAFPDAVAAGAAGFPVLLVPSTGEAPAEVKAALAALNPLGMLVLGGPGAVSDHTLASLLS
jgi:putative cell wall-binding protein